jgi:hypothetical protein
MSENRTRQVFTNSGASYELQVVRGADHKLDDIHAVIQKAEGQTIAEKAIPFFWAGKTESLTILEKPDPFCGEDTGRRERCFQNLRPAAGRLSGGSYRQTQQLLF